MEHVIIPSVLFAMIFGIVYVAITANNRENIAMIEAGMNPKGHKQKKHNKLRFAFLAFTVPVGILIGNLTHSYFNMDAEPTAVAFGFLFGGVGLIASYFVEEHKEKNTSSTIDED